MRKILNFIEETMLLATVRLFWDLLTGKTHLRTTIIGNWPCIFLFLQIFSRNAMFPSLSCWYFCNFRTNNSARQILWRHFLYLRHRGDGLCWPRSGLGSCSAHICWSEDLIIWAPSVAQLNGLKEEQEYLNRSDIYLYKIFRQPSKDQILSDIFFLIENIHPW